MKPDDRKWSDSETLFLFKVFLTEPSKNLNSGSPLVMELSEKLSRTPGSIHRKLEDIRSNDPGYIARGRKPTNCAVLVKEIWANLAEDHSATLSKMNNAYLQYCEDSVEVGAMLIDEINPGIDIPYMSSYRSGQPMFRLLVASNFDRRCCITGISMPELLVASHIKPWAESTPMEKTDPRNGLYLNRLHDGLFDRFLMTLDEDMRIVYSDRVRDCMDEDVFESFFGKSEHARIRRPSRYEFDDSFMSTIANVHTRCGGANRHEIMPFEETMRRICSDSETHSDC